MKEYWDNRFISEGLIWGERPSETVYAAKEIFLENDVRTVLVPGAGYGRNTKLLSDTFQVDAIELSSEAITLARLWDSKSNFIEQSIFDLPDTNKKYDAIFCYGLIHLFTESDRAKLVNKCLEQLAQKGVYYFTCFSDEDAAYGIGKEVEYNTFEYKRGKIAHFFSEDDLRNRFKESKIIETGSLEENFEYANDTIKTYKLRYILGMKH
ncbi:class I SAM-dependent methyltransferase [Paenibacillus sp. GSMTC-2017]|uniref:class I SAM-dependent methyltransferase n=1 Tax=Paenibacillus sp. GSMTC-2017 TaxID=2794350 RepID=UPI0018D739B6|nr:class I SAM-dependent methyltransferase [Paenibacillus sp. GSMTC-2017]MBH5316526.1 class I SAM-dependent methyltransferase [Paenibacillus sp. GSMTC-2017]